ncbi:MAG: hypothetical protein P4M00_10365 [Azospirillaceae bacterium]|nr:hypothetical protein [Azospirillaceae bacterium]
MQEIEDRDAAARLQHADDFAHRLVTRLLRRDIVDHGHRDDGVECRVAKGQPCDIPGFDLDPVGNVFHNCGGPRRVRIVVGKVRGPKIDADGLAGGEFLCATD